MRRWLLLIIILAAFAPCAHAVQATVPSCTFAAGKLGGVQATCVNPNSTASNAAIMCFTEDGTTPSTNGTGTGCTTGLALSPVVAASAEYNGYFTIMVNGLTIKIIAGVNTLTDSTVATYTPAVTTQTILATHFGAQCGPGQVNNCKNPSPPPTILWPINAAFPATNCGIMRLHDSNFPWSIVQPANGTFIWTTVDAYLDALAAHPCATGMIQLTMFPCWAAGLLNTDPSCQGVSGNGKLPNYGNNTAIPPTDLGTGPYGSSPSFNTYISTLLAHTSANGNGPVSSLVQIWQLANEVDLCVHYTGTFAQMYAMSQYPAQLIRAAVPGAVIGSPSMTPAFGTNINCGPNGSGGGVTTAVADITSYLNLENTNGVVSDFSDYHVYLFASNTTVNIPETQFAGVNAHFSTGLALIPGWKNAPWMDSETSYSASTSLFSGSYTCPSSATPSPPTSYSVADCAAFSVRWQILHDSAFINSVLNGSLSLDWYYWNWGFVTNGVSATYASVYNFAQQYLTGGHYTGAAALSSGTTWTAPFVGSDSVTKLLVWTTSESAGQTFVVPAGYTRYRDLAGGITPAVAGNTVPISVQPIMLEQATSQTAPAPFFAGLSVQGNSIFQ